MNAPHTCSAANVPTEPVLVRTRGGAARLDITTRHGSSTMRRRIEQELEPGKSWTIGSSGESDLTIDDRAVSRTHCRLSHHGSELVLDDLGSRNGVYVGGARVVRARLPLDAGFEIGRTHVRIECVEAVGDELLPGLVGTASSLVAMARLVRRCAAITVPVLIRGESGTGKELVARALHLCGQRAERPFVALNAGAVSPALAESELFGHCKGAFTGADRDRPGAFRRAHGGTLFLDELGALPVELQAKLLRVVEERVVWPLGADTPECFDVRIVTASCEPLEDRVRRGEFRADLYERLATCVVRVPPLRERPGDIPPLASHLAAHLELGPFTVSAGALEALQSHHWPGNVRELRNVLFQAGLLSCSSSIQRGAVARALSERGRVGPDESRPVFAGLAPADAEELVRRCGGNVSHAARTAGLARSTFRDLLRVARPQNAPTRPSPPCVSLAKGMTAIDGGASELAVSTK